MAWPTNPESLADFEDAGIALTRREDFGKLDLTVQAFCDFAGTYRTNIENLTGGDASLEGVLGCALLRAVQIGTQSEHEVDQRNESIAELSQKIFGDPKATEGLAGILYIDNTESVSVLYTLILASFQYGILYRRKQPLKVV